MTLSLSLNGLTVTFTQFTNYDRTLAETGQTEYAIAGTPLDSGPAYEPKHIWSVGAVTTIEQWHSLYAIYLQSDSLRRTGQNYRILIDDNNQELIESGTKTRSLANGGTVTTFSGGVAYPAQFYARLFEPKSQKTYNGIYPYIVTFTLRELDKVSA